jgi:hypothetical protein
MCWQEPIRREPISLDLGTDLQPNRLKPFGSKGFSVPRLSSMKVGTVLVSWFDQFLISSISHIQDLLNPNDTKSQNIENLTLKTYKWNKQKLQFAK